MPEFLAWIVSALLLVAGLIFGFGEVKQRLGRSKEKQKFEEYRAQQEAINALRSKSVAAAPDRSPDERADLVRELARLSVRHQRHS